MVSTVWTGSHTLSFMHQLSTSDIPLTNLPSLPLSSMHTSLLPIPKVLSWVTYFPRCLCKRIPWWVLTVLRRRRSSSLVLVCLSGKSACHINKPVLTCLSSSRGSAIACIAGKYLLLCCVLSKEPVVLTHTFASIEHATWRWTPGNL